MCFARCAASAARVKRSAFAIAARSHLQTTPKLAAVQSLWQHGPIQQHNVHNLIPPPCWPLVSGAMLVSKGGAQPQRVHKWTTHPSTTLPLPGSKNEQLFHPKSKTAMLQGPQTKQYTSLDG